MGSLSILNAGKGDIKITYNKGDLGETIRARRIVQDIIKRGYVLLVEIDGKYTRATKFDERANEFVIADFDPREGERNEPQKEESAQAPQKKRGRPAKRVRMESVDAVGIGRSSGG